MTMPETAADYVMGALSPLEREAVQLERAVNRTLDAAIAALEDKLAPLAVNAGHVRPPDYLFDAIVAQIREEEAELGNKLILPLDEGDWQPCLPGVEIKRLWSPLTFLLRCQPGAIIPEHPHGPIENLLVVMGDLEVGGRILSSGDYHQSPAGSDHGETRTRHGCVLFVQYSS